MCSQQAAGVLQPDAFLKLQRAHRGNRAKMPVKRRCAHPGQLRQVVDAH